MPADPLQLVAFHIVIVRSASDVVWGTCDTHGGVPVARAPGKRSKAIRRASIAPFCYCDNGVYVMFFGL